MTSELFILMLIVLLPMAGLIAYYDVRYRRIPNWAVLGALLSGLVIQTSQGGLKGLILAVAGCAFAFALMFVIYLFGGMGAGDVKLFAAIGALIGAGLVLPTFVAVVTTGGVLALGMTLWKGTARETIRRVWGMFARWLPGGLVLRGMEKPAVRQTVPYGVAITLGSLVSTAMVFLRS
ncbi:MAG: prepilin peptidase [Acidobacteria bacterium]|nr:prepilin peptidase [Acidobacteriota bacterium]MCW5971050.1 prepilin peptidase [Blastocatellales bacterium]